MPARTPEIVNRHKVGRNVLQASLAVCTVYFICMSAAHFFSVKYPILFIYWDTPFYAYQDKIISFCAALYAALFYEAFADPEHLSGLAARSMLITTIGLSLVNISDELNQVLDPTKNNIMFYWAQTVFISLIGLWLTFWRYRAGFASLF